VTAIGILIVLVLLFFIILHRNRLLRYLDEHFPGLLRCFELKEGNRRFSLDPTRDIHNLPFTPNNEDRRDETNPTNSTMQTNADEMDRAETWSSSDSVQDSTPSRWSGKRSTQNNFDPNADNADTLNEIRSGLIEVMDSDSLNSETASHCTSPPPLQNPNLRVETRPPACKTAILNPE
jgi:hypothetical protein